MNWSEKDVVGLIGIQNLQIQYTFGGNLGRVWSDFVTPGGNPARPAITDVQFVGTPTLNLEYITPQINQPIPQIRFYPYYEIGRYITKGAVVPAFGQPNCTVKNFPSDTISFSSVPKRIYVYLKERENGVIGNAVQQTDTFAVINTLSMNWNNQAGVLSSASQKDLYDMSVRAGSDQSWIQFSRLQGSVVCIEPGISIPLGALEANGSKGNYQMQFTVSYTNNKAVQCQFDLYILGVLEGYLEINNQTCRPELHVLTEEMVAKASVAPSGMHRTIKNLYGGAWYNDIWDAIKKPFNWASKIGEAVAPALSAIPGYGAILSPVVSGVSEVCVGSPGVAQDQEVDQKVAKAKAVVVN